MDDLRFQGRGLRDLSALRGSIIYLDESDIILPILSSPFFGHRIPTKGAEIGPMPKPSPDDEEEKDAKEHSNQRGNPPPASIGSSIPEAHRSSLLSIFGGFNNALAL